MLKLIQRKCLPEGYEMRPVGRMIRAGLQNELKVARHALNALPTARFVIFAQGRTGSTLLTSTLDTHHQITCKDEILATPRAFPIQFVENVARGSGAHCFGFHVKIYQLTSWQRIENVHGWLSSLNERGWNIVYLRRENLLRHVVSNLFAEAAGAWHHRTSEPTSRPDQIELPITLLEQGIEGRRRYVAAERAALDGLDYLELVYERDLETAEAQADTFERIQDYLGIDRTPLKPVLKKAILKPLDRLITNYDEVRDVLVGTPDEIYLAE